MGGLRGSVSLILAQTVLSLEFADDIGGEGKLQERITAEMGLYTTGKGEARWDLRSPRAWDLIVGFEA